MIRFVLSMLIFGTIGIFRRYIPFSSAFLTFSRGILGGLFLLGVAGIRKRKGAGVPGRDALRFAVTGAMIGINWILLFEAYSYTTVAVATLCYYMQPTIVILLSPLIFHERMTGKKAVCAAVSVVGMVLVSGVADPGGGSAGNLRGVLLGLGAALFYSAVVIMNKKHPGGDAVQKTTVQLFSAGLVMIPYLLLKGGWPAGSPAAGDVILLLVVGIVHTGIAYLMYFEGMKGMSVQSVSMLSYIDPVSALVLSAVFLREPMSLWNMVGAVLIIGAAAVSEMERTKK